MHINQKKYLDFSQGLFILDFVPVWQSENLVTLRWGAAEGVK